MIGDLINSLLRSFYPLLIKGVDLFHQLKLHEIFKIYTDLRSGKACMEIQLIQLMVSLCNNRQNTVVDSGFPELLFHDSLPFLKEQGILPQNMAADVFLYGKILFKALPKSRKPP